MALHHLHHVMAAVLKALGTPPPPNAPKPALHNATMVELAAFLARQVADHVPRAERSTWSRLVELAAPVREVDGLTSKALAELDRLMKGSLDDDELPVPGTSPTLAVALMLGVEARTCDAHGSCGKAARHGAVAASKVLGVALVPLLDAELARLDAVTHAQKQELTLPRPIAATLWRGTSGVKTTHWLVRLTDDSFGLIAKTRGKWSWTPGSRDDVLATVPDAMMVDAVAAVLGGKPASEPTASATHVIIEFTGRVEAVGLTPDGAVVVVATPGRLWAWTTHDGRQAAVPKNAAAVLAAEPGSPFPPKANTLTVRGQTVKLDRAGITSVVETPGATLVGYHQSKRVAVFDELGTQRHLVTARELGESIETVLPLKCGLILGYATWPKGTVALVDQHARTLSAARLGKFFTGVRRRFVDVGSAVALALSGPPTGSRVIVFRC
jgi:hypothetical protein